MVIEYIRYQIPAERHAAFVETYRAAKQELAASPHCVRYEISQGIEEPDHFIVRIEWDSVEGHEQGFRRSAEFPAFFARVKPCFADTRQMKHYRVQ